MEEGEGSEGRREGRKAGWVRGVRVKTEVREATTATKHVNILE